MFHSLSISLVLSRLDHGNATLPGIPQYLLRRLQFLHRGMTTSLRFSVSCTGSRRRSELTSSWLSCIQVLTWSSTVVGYLTDELCLSADLSPRRRLRSAPSSSLIVSRTRLSTISNRAFPVAAAVRTRVQRAAAARNIASLPTFRRRLKTHLFQRCFP